MTLARRILRVLAYLYGAYLVLCLLVLLPLMNFFAPRVLLEETGRTLRSEILLFNPFNLALEIRGASLTEQDGHKPLAFKRVLVDLSLESLWQPGIVLDRVWVEEVDLHVLRYADGAFHFDDLLSGAEDQAREDDTDGSALPFTLHDLRIDAHTLTYTDRTRPGPFRTVHTDFGLQTRNLTTVPGRQGDGLLELIGDGGGRLSWQGDLDLGNGVSRGRLELENIDLTPAWRYQKDDLAFVANSARLDVDLTYTADWAGDLDVEVEQSTLALRAIDIAPADPERFPNTGLSLEALNLEGIYLDLIGTRAGAASLNLSGLQLAGFDDGDVVSLRDIFMDPGASEMDASGVEPQSEQAPGDAAAQIGDPAVAPPWDLSLARFTLKESEARWRTPQLAPDELVIAPIRASAETLGWPARESSSLALSFTLNEETDLTLGGDLNLASGAGEMRLNLSDFNLAWLDPLVQEQARTDLKRGRLSVTSTARLDNFEPQHLASNVVVDDFGTVLHETGEEAFSLQKLSIDGMIVEPPSKLVTIERLSVQAPRGSFQILEDGSVNVNGIIRSGPEAGSGIAEVEVEDTPWRVLLSEFVIGGGRLDFADDSLPLPFKTRIEEIEAQIKDIDSAAETPLTVTLNGNVDGYAPVIIEGSGTPHAEQSDGKLRFRFRGVDIATMSPYSGTYAGYTIESGTLSLDLSYALAGNVIDGNNRVVISQMQLGEPVESELAVQVPLKLGLALLTDADGVIDLSVPVRGDVNDPEFSIGSVIGKALLNVVTKAVTAPFRLLAGLVNSEANLENIAFGAGETTLTIDGESSLEALASALNQRPQLYLRILGSVDPVSDGLKLRQEALEQKLIDEGLDEVSLRARDEAWEQRIEERYATVFSTPDGADRDPDSDAETVPLPIEDKWQALLQSVALPPAALEDLGTERAAAAKRELVTVGGIDAARIAIAYEADLAFQGVQMELDG